MPFNNDIAGGNGQLVRNWIQSVDYVAGISGWRISKDGSAEFNDGTFRGSIEVGPNPGQHFIVNNPVTGDVVDIYDSGNNLVFRIDSNGFVNTYDTLDPDVPTIQIAGGGIGFSDNLTHQSGEITIGEIAGSTILRMSSPVLTAGGTALNLELIAPSAAGGSYALLDSHGTTGTVVQNDDNTGANGRLHFGTYVITTGAGGAATFNHNAGFTPVRGWMSGVNGIAANFFYQYAWFTAPFTSTTAHAQFLDNLGNPLANTTVGGFGIFQG